MSDTLESLRKKIGGATDLQSVVHSMKALAASSIAQYEHSVRSLGDYSRAIEMGLAICLRTTIYPAHKIAAGEGAAGAILFGSDQGLTGQFNQVLADFALTELRALPGKKHLWIVGERLESLVEDPGVGSIARFSVPGSVEAITPLVGQILVECETHREKQGLSELHLFHNRPKSSPVYEPVRQLLLPLDETWRRETIKLRWPTGNLPEMLGAHDAVLKALVHEYLYVSLFRGCAESLASENASRLAAMQRAEKKIGELLEDLNRTFHLLRQSAIDEELFDVISGFEALQPRSPTRSVKM